MGLSIQVGSLAYLLVNDAEGAASLREDFSRLNAFLGSVGLEPHIEPQDCAVFSCDMYGYLGLHYLRRVAAHLDLEGVLPPPGQEDDFQDEAMEAYYLSASRPSGGWLDRFFGRRPMNRTFDHLMLHSDAEGFYLPQTFPQVLMAPDKFGVPGSMVGSSVRLLEECRRLAQALELPLDLDPESDLVWDATQTQGQGDTQWQRYAIESFTCLRLHKACIHSLETGAAIVFC
ncbi:MAG TPA: hypothetical protein PL151_20805 [Phycisphaerae bacterium]|nr:hypothetical protein [Phycisphaerae bacterium]HOJ74709.1 hypothetical protein [Phycisphaerae bacterium]HOM52078.1 hypothetical protein [Phycisphaerae bacterium]HON65534.1 hypothetical protein [Phycisphaerae bacterium]HOQ86121.1 hypothetical protein [Phycisphaerae bacterium]